MWFGNCRSGLTFLCIPILKTLNICQYRQILLEIVWNDIIVRHCCVQPPLWRTDRAMENVLLHRSLLGRHDRAQYRCLSTSCLSSFRGSMALLLLEFLISEFLCRDGLLVVQGFLLLDGSLGIGFLRIRMFHSRGHHRGGSREPSHRKKGNYRGPSSRPTGGDIRQQLEVTTIVRKAIEYISGPMNDLGGYTPK